MSCFYLTMFSSLFYLVVSLQASPSLETKSAPHILWVVADDLGGTDLSSFGAEFPTPVLDELVETGIKLKSYYVQLVCSPTRTSFMTGRYPIHTGLQHIVIFQDQDAAISLSHPTIAEVVKTNWNYSTHLIGKWHNGHASWENIPLARGFDTWYGWNGGSSDYYTHMIDAQIAHGHNGYAMFDGTKGWEETPVPAWSDKGTYSTDLWTAQAVDRVQGHDFSTPFFMYLAYQSPHAPVQASPDQAMLKRCQNLTRGEGRDVYCTMVSRMDTKVNEVVLAIKAKSAWENTLMIFTTDNGGCMPPENRGCNAPLRGGKHHLFEGGVRGLGFISGGLIPNVLRGSESWSLMHATDWYQTIIGAICAKTNNVPPQIPDLDGLDLWSTLMNVSNANISSILTSYSPRTEIPHNVDPLLKSANGQPQGALRMSQFKLIVGDLDIGWLSCSMTLTPAPKNQGLNGTYMLFDLAADPNEYSDLSEIPEHKATLLNMIERYKYWEAQTVPPNYPGSDNRSYPELNSGIYHDAWKPWLGVPHAEA
eukprot:m.185331 g.185331  ORF g.185331 m.185331 type:complete len:534 (-) comp32231_c0_seq2:245-1846(-)